MRPIVASAPFFARTACFRSAVVSGVAESPSTAATASSCVTSADTASAVGMKMVDGFGIAGAATVACVVSFVAACEVFMAGSWALAVDLVDGIETWACVVSVSVWVFMMVGSVLGAVGGYG